jgi:adenylate kinase
MIILFGPAGSGKSVQGKILAQKYGWEWMSVGHMLLDKSSADLEE